MKKFSRRNHFLSNRLKQEPIEFQKQVEEACQEGEENKYATFFDVANAVDEAERMQLSAKLQG